MQLRGEELRLVDDLVVQSRSVISSHHRLFTSDIPLDELSREVVGVSLALVELQSRVRHGR